MPEPPSLQNTIKELVQGEAGASFRKVSERKSCDWLDFDVFGKVEPVELGQLS